MPGVTQDSPGEVVRRGEGIDTVLTEPGWDKYADYVTGQRPRLELLVDLVGGFIADRPGARVLDAGPGLQTAAIRAEHPEATVDSLGYALEEAPPRDGERHVEYDLNLLYQRDTWPDIGGYDVIVFAEILEHLCTAPQAVFDALASWLAPGGRLIVQTPNALDLPSRVRALAGKIPAGGIATLPSAGMNPGHFREYTIGEVETLGERADLRVESTEIREYFVRAGFKGRMWGRVTRRLPPSLRTGTTVVFVR